MKIDLSPKAIANRLKAVNELRKVCLSLAKSNAGREIMKKNSKNKTVQRTLYVLGR